MRCAGIKKMRLLSFIFLLSLAFCQAQQGDSLALNRLSAKSLELYHSSNPDSAWLLFPALLDEIKHNQFWPLYRKSCAWASTVLGKNSDLFSIVDDAERLRDSLQKYRGSDRSHYSSLNGNLGLLFQRVGDFGKMQKAFEEVIAINEGIVHQYLSLDYQNLASSYRFQGDWIASLTYNQKALAIWEMEGKPSTSSWIPITYANAGRVAAFLKRWRLAISYYLATFSMNNTKWRVHAAHGLSNAYLEMGKIDSATYYLEQAKTIVHEGKVLYIPVSYELESKILMAQGRYPEALAAAQKSQQLRLLPGESPRPDDLARGEELIAKAFFALGEWDSVHLALNRGLTYFVDRFSKEAFPFNLIFKQDALPLLKLEIEVLRAQKKLGEALQLCESATQIVQELRRSRIGESNKLILNEYARWITELAFITIWDLNQNESDDKIISGHYQRAWAISESYHGAILVDELTENEQFYRTNLPDSLRQEEQNKRWKISYFKTKLNNAIRKGSREEALQSIRNDLFKEEEDYRKLYNFLGENWPVFQSDAKYYDFALQAVSFDKVIPGQMVISYFEGHEDLFILTYMEGKSHLYKKDIPSSYKSWSENLEKEIQGKDLSPESCKNYSFLAEKLSQFLLSGILDSDEIETLLIIADGSLNKIPFEALLSIEDQDQEAMDKSDFRSLPYLFTQYKIRYVHALNLLEFSYPLKPAKEGLAIFAPTYSGILSLPQNAQVADGLMANVKAENFSDAFYSSKISFSSLVSQYAMLHLALHGESDTSNASQSYLQFPLESGEDNRLYTHEIYNLRLPANLISLASCEVGDGRLEAGEGLMSLGRAFRYAGAATVLSSRWKADARVTGRIFPLFYGYLAEGKASDEAFALARRDFLKDAPPSLAHPFYWANFAHWGEAYTHRSSRNYYWIFGLVIIGLAFFSIRYGVQR